MHKLNQSINDKINSFDSLLIFIFSLLPISLIIGNAAINLNILIINFFLLFYCLKNNYWYWLKNKIFLYLILLYFYLIFNSIYSFYFIVENETGGIFRSILFIKFILLIFAFSTFLKDDQLLEKVLKNWLIISIIVIIDVIFEKFFGHNILGFTSPDPSRAVSFFKDELVVGGYILCVGYPAVTYFLKKNTNDKFFLFFVIILLLIPLTIFLTGERSNFIKCSLLFFTIIFFVKKNRFYFNYKSLFILFIIFISFITIFNKTSQIRYYEFFKRIQVADSNVTILDKLQNIRYIAHFDTAIKIFKNYPLSGIGNKNFRKECSKDLYFEKKIKFSEQRCSTHPHQIHFEILSEQGILGYLIIISFMLFFLFQNFKIFFKNKNIYHLSNIMYLSLFFVPILPGGGIFSTFNGSTFWIIFSLCNLVYEKK
tara:strand:- start:58 stop:1335 length:1278 start_codon:yes stop_codon:yes gene_type:complete